MTFYNIIYGILFFASVREVFKAGISTNGFFWESAILAVIIFSDVIYTSHMIEEQKKPYNVWMKFIDLANFIIISCALLAINPEEHNLIDQQMILPWLDESARHIAFWIFLLLYWLLLLLWEKQSNKSSVTMSVSSVNRQSGFRKRLLVMAEANIRLKGLIGSILIFLTVVMALAIPISLCSIEPVLLTLETISIFLIGVNFELLANAEQ